MSEILALGLIKEWRNCLCVYIASFLISEHARLIFFFSEAYLIFGSGNERPVGIYSPFGMNDGNGIIYYIYKNLNHDLFPTMSGCFFNVNKVILHSFIPLQHMHIPIHPSIHPTKHLSIYSFIHCDGLAK